jgi:aryl-alcohol dehydrogenase-like predicted oxidoreductase
VPACERFGIGILPYFPLASGLLTGKYRRGDAPPEGGRIAAWGMTGLLSDTNFDLVEALESFAAERDLTLLDVAMGGLAARPAVASVIAGATTPEQVRANAAAGLWEPTDDDDEALGVLTGRG